MKRLFFVLAVLAILTWLQGCSGDTTTTPSSKAKSRQSAGGEGGGKGKRNRGAQSDLETRINRLERRVAQLESQAGRQSVGMEYTRVSPRELKESPENFEGKKIRMMGRTKTLDLESNTMIITRGQNEIKVDLSTLDESFRTRLNNISTDENLPRRLIVMGTFKEGVFQAEKIQMLRRGSGSRGSTLGKRRKDRGGDGSGQGTRRAGSGRK